LPKYSVCITTRNNIATIRDSLDSLISKIDRREWEVVVVDAESDDGQIAILRDYEAQGQIKLLVSKGNRGEGRQIALLNSSGDYVISGIDTDDVLGPGFGPLVKRYHTDFEGSMIFAGITIAPRILLTWLGGWKPLFHGEDFDLWNRAEKMGRFVRIETPGDLFVSRVRHKRGKLDVVRILWAYIEQGRRPIVSWKTWSVYQGLRVIHWIRAKTMRRSGPKRSRV
jgi:glycosyltransferase involved in cell wall biosynthesis